MESPKESFFEAERLKAAGKKKKEAASARSLSHTEESREEEKRVNPPGKSGGRGYVTPFLNVEDIADIQMNPEEELMAKEEADVDGGVHENEDITDESSSEHSRPEDYREYHDSREEWEKHLRSLSDQNYAAQLRAKEFKRKRGVETSKTPEEPAFVKDIPEALLNKSKQEKISPGAPGQHGEDARHFSKSDKKRGKEGTKKRELFKSVKVRKRVKKEFGPIASAKHYTDLWRDG
jgi:hypothetical protein